MTFTVRHALGSLAVGVLLASRPASGEPVMATVGPGTYRPFYPASPKEAAIPLKAFQLDRTPVTNGEFLKFVQENPAWRRDRVGRLFADANYLQQWETAESFGTALDARQPVVSVSWFAAKAYCRARGARLPREAEWEFAAQASDHAKDGRSDVAFRERIVAWYSKPNPARLPTVGSGVANAWGVHDLHGLVWEWVLDFNATLVSSDDREAGDKDRMRFCGVGALGATDKTDFSSFMRIAFRSSLHADFTTKNLGFRCAQDVKGGKP